ncbi:MAG: alpha/beta fold hydrolase [Pseudomonadota bacterium]
MKTEAVRDRRLAASSAEGLLGPNPFLGFRAYDVAREAMRVAKLTVVQPKLAARSAARFVKELAAIRSDASTLAPSSRDKRFADAAWQADPRYRKLLQVYLAFERSLHEWTDSQVLPMHSRARLEFMLSLLVDAVAPSNLPIHPEALRRFRETGGHSALDGVKHLVRDFRENGGYPAQVDKTQFAVGGNLANTEGDVVFRTEVLELIQYRPRTERVREVPVLLVPPQINKFYVFDLTPEKSLVRGLLDQGFEVWCISWRNPTAEQRDWGLAEYAAAIDMAIGTICQIRGASKVSMVGACAGGMTLAAYAATRAASGDARVNSLTLMVNVLDTGAIGDTPLGLFATPRAIAAVRRRTAKKGVLDGKEMGSAFTWLRPNDLIWNYWVNNVLLGKPAPAFDVLYWNGDATRLPARLHSEFIDIFLKNALTVPGRLRLNGVPVDVKRIRCDSYITGGTTDHITPWRGCFRTTQLFGGDCTFTLANAGHMQSILSPPGGKKTEFWTGRGGQASADEWKASATHQSGSWWLHWHAWLQERSGDWKPAAAEPGSADHPPLVAAPGTYVHQ